MRHQQRNGRKKMTRNTTLIIATIVIYSCFAAAAAAADDQDAVVETTAQATPDTAKLNSSLAASANTAAVEEAIEAVLAENKLDLEFRFIGRTSMEIADGR
jgi:hypothetical protein